MTLCKICEVRGDVPATGEFVVLVGNGVVKKCKVTQRPDGCRWLSVAFRRLGLNEIVVMFAEVEDDSTDFNW